MTATDTEDIHTFTSSWRWTDTFESWVKELIDGKTVNVCAGLSPVGDVRVDLMDPVESIEVMQEDDKTDLEDAKRALSGVIPDGHPEPRIAERLYKTEEPRDHRLASALKTGSTVRADAFASTGLPFEDDSFDWTLCDPPWKELPDRIREMLFGELVRITKPGGHILFNAYWIETHEQVTLDEVRVRKDSDRYQSGTPSVSYASIYTVYPSGASATYLSLTLSPREHAPEPESLSEIFRATTAYELECINGIDPAEYDLEVISPSEQYECPRCGGTAFDSVSADTWIRAPEGGELYKCLCCGYPTFKNELEEGSSEDLQQPDRQRSLNWFKENPRVTGNTALREELKESSSDADGQTTFQVYVRN